MDSSEYESLPTNDIIPHMMAGALAGVGEHCVMYPVDCVKTRMQSIQPNPNATYRTIPEAFYKIIRYEGIFRPVRGINAVLTGAGPAHALYYSCYEFLKETLTANAATGHQTVAIGLAGMVATILHDAVMNPVEVIKQRMQMFDSPYRTCRECLRTVLKTEGIRAFYRSYTTQMTMNIPYQTIHFQIYEIMQDLTNEKRIYSPTAHMLSGACAGAFAAAVTTPLDVCKTLLNTQETKTLQRTNQVHIRGMFHAMQVVYQLRGIPGYFQGLQPRVLFQMPATAIAWSVYEFFKYFLKPRQSHGSGSNSSNNHLKVRNTQLRSQTGKDKVTEKFAAHASVSAKSPPVNVMSDFQSTTKAAVTVAAAGSP